MIRTQDILDVVVRYEFKCNILLFTEYKKMFDVFATAAETLPKHQLKVFFNHCDHHPSEKDINFAFNAVFRSTYFKTFGAKFMTST